MSSCNFEVNHWFGNPCTGTHKYMKVAYDCVASVPPCPSSDGWTTKSQYCEFDGSGISVPFNSISKIYLSHRHGSGAWYGSYAEAKDKCEALDAPLVREPDMLEAVRLCCHFLHFNLSYFGLNFSGNLLEQGLGIQSNKGFYQACSPKGLLDWTEN